MRRFMLPAALAAALFAGPAAHAQSGPALPKAPDRLPAPAAKPDEKTRPNTLESLFERLSAAKDEGEAQGIATLIERRWSRSGSDTADLLMSRAGEAFRDKEYGLAIELLDRVLTLRPAWAEAWHRRATAFYLLDDPVRAMSDLQQAIAREPRHFGALAGLGHILMANDDKKRALEAYRRAFAIHPHMEKLKDLIDRLKPDVDGVDL
ncbi:tetratricopeptide repeat protein [Salinarimonas soli]|uniref:Uncharacterized protein n=1 Tax=Salinarimonas soli TaxID=1638099 RepID=A0A5B2VSM5_9HYPH|nr:tetratricopeptide repeat protein [Salinarimonas soli]KAA2241237.1 hypothetical protein F0L46_04375 [Salinarimonas soli]